MKDEIAHLLYKGSFTCPANDLRFTAEVPKTREQARNIGADCKTLFGPVPSPLEANSQHQIGEGARLRTGLGQADGPKSRTEDNPQAIHAGYRVAVTGGHRASGAVKIRQVPEQPEADSNSRPTEPGSRPASPIPSPLEER